MGQVNRLPKLAAWRQERRRLEAGHVPAGSRRGIDYFLLGCVLFAAYALQAAGAIRWPWLGELQADDFYKQISGFGLLAYIAQQWHLSVLRSRGLTRKAGTLLRNHKLLGALAPLFLYAHAQNLGYAYQQALIGVFLGVFLSGLFNQEISAVRVSWFRSLWVMVHAGLATALLVLLAYHVYVTYAYQ